MLNPKSKYYKIQSKSQNQNPKIYNIKIGSIGIWDFLGSIGMYWSFGFFMVILNFAF